MKTDRFCLSKVLFLIIFIAWIMNFSRCKGIPKSRNKKACLSRVKKNNKILELNLFYFEFCK